MSDPLDRLTEFGSSFEGGAMPKSPAEVRARGDQIRRRRHALVAGAAAAAVVAVAVPVVAVVGSPGGSDSTPPAESPSVTDSATVAPADPITAANLLTAPDVERNDAAGGILVDVSATYRGDGHAAVNPCQEAAFSDLGATTVIQRDFGFSAAEGGDGDADHHLNQAIAQFPTAADARAAADEVARWLDGCVPTGAEDVSPVTGPWIEVDVPGAEARTGRMHYGPADATPGSQYDVTGRDDLRWYLETGTVVAGDRLAIVTDLDLGSETASETSVLGAILPAAAERLTATAAPTETETGEAGSGLIPEGFPLAAGWPDDSEAEPGEEGLDGPSPDLPSLEFTACGETFVGPEYADRLRANWTSAEDFRARQLSVYADAAAAAAAADGLAEFFEACGTGPVRDDGFRTEYEVRPLDVADGAWAILQRDTLDGAESPFGQTTIVVRQATAVLVLDRGGHAGYPRGDGQAVIDAMLDGAADVLAALPVIEENVGDGGTGPGATGEPALDDPAATVAVPDDLPIDASLGGGGTSEGPGRQVLAVAPNTICGQDLSIPTFESIPRPSRLEYHVADEAISDGRMVAAYPTVQDAVDTVETLRSQVADCDRDDDGDGRADRLWTRHDGHGGYDSVSFSWTYEEQPGVGAPAGVLYTVTRVGNAILALAWQSEGGAGYRADQVADQLRLVDAIAPSMCIFTADGC